MQHHIVVPDECPVMVGPFQLIGIDCRIDGIIDATEGDIDFLTAFQIDPIQICHVLLVIYMNVLKIGDWWI